MNRFTKKQKRVAAVVLLLANLLAAGALVRQGQAAASVTNCVGKPNCGCFGGAGMSQAPMPNGCEHSFQCDNF